MADEKKKNPSQGKKSGGRKRNRRRYFRRKKDASGQSGDAEKREGSSGDQKKSRSNQKRRSSSQRNRRRRRRSRSSGYTGPSIVQEIDTNYVPPESVYVYTHVLRPDQRDNYAFRSELAHGTGRTLDDFRIDLSLIFSEGGDPIPQTAARSVERATAQYREERAQGLHAFDEEDENVENGPGENGAVADDDNHQTAEDAA